MLVKKITTTNVKAVNKLHQHWSTMLSIARDTLIEEQEKQKTYADKKRYFCELKEGEMRDLCNNHDDRSKCDLCNDHDDHNERDSCNDHNDHKYNDHYDRDSCES
ncbi:4882_t:CDS:2 [Racocetra persica]|uniref:4882_t:CDS:1 n=1 Tax=Racocetra persica TaxID=160502 RepID=A0ACA9NIJ3_9GLOM|nr:4882_t:CDS:2 [Racocetra persica]